MELARVLGRDPTDMPRIRKTDDQRISVIDVAVAVTGTNDNEAGEAVRTVFRDHPGIQENILNANLPDQSGRPRRGTQTSPVTDARTMVEGGLSSDRTQVRQVDNPQQSLDNPRRRRDDAEFVQVCTPGCIA